jgi:hypothetical protein
MVAKSLKFMAILAWAIAASLTRLGKSLGSQRIGERFNPARWHESFPPEAVDEVDAEQGGTIFDSDDAPAVFKSNLVAEPSIDVWAFGKLAYEMLLESPCSVSTFPRNQAKTNLHYSKSWNGTNPE